MHDKTNKLDKEIQDIKHILNTLTQQVNSIMDTLSSDPTVLDDKPTTPKSTSKPPTKKQKEKDTASASKRTRKQAQISSSSDSDHLSSSSKILDAVKNIQSTLVSVMSRVTSVEQEKDDIKKTYGNKDTPSPNEDQEILDDANADDKFFQN